MINILKVGLPLLFKQYLKESDHLTKILEYDNEELISSNTNSIHYFCFLVIDKNINFTNYSNVSCKQTKTNG